MLWIFLILQSLEGEFSGFSIVYKRSCGFCINSNFISQFVFSGDLMINKCKVCQNFCCLLKWSYNFISFIWFTCCITLLDRQTLSFLSFQKWNTFDDNVQLFQSMLSCFSVFCWDFLHPHLSDILIFSFICFMFRLFMFLYDYVYFI